MNQRSIVLIALVIGAVACGKKAPSTPATDCEGAVDNIVKLSGDGLKAEGVDLGKFREVILARCKEDGWSGVATECFKKSTKDESLRTCKEGIQGKAAPLTPDQQKKLDDAMTSISEGSGAAGSDMGSAGSAAGSAGSDAGSASGSAK